MASYAFRKVFCVDPCDSNQVMTRNLSLLVQIVAAPTNTKTHMSRPVEGWKSEPILINKARMVDKIEENTVIQKIHVIDPVFGNQIVQYITDQAPVVHFNASYDKKEIAAIWPQAIRVPVYNSGQARASLLYEPGEIYIDGARTDFSTSYNDKYPAAEEIPADDVPTYCHCLLQGDDPSGRTMIQCSNGERYCLKEWYHIECIEMAEKDIPPDDWFCEECVERKLGRLSEPGFAYTSWQRANREPAAGTIAAWNNDRLVGIKSGRSTRARNREEALRKELEMYETQFRDAMLLSQATGGPGRGRKRSASV